MFPAYDRDIPRRPLVPPDEENDFSGRFGSFVSKSTKKCESKERKCEHQERKAKEKAKRKKELERERLLSHHSIKVLLVQTKFHEIVEKLVQIRHITILASFLK